MFHIRDGKYPKKWVHADDCPTGKCRPDPFYWYPREAPWWCSCVEDEKSPAPWDEKTDSAATSSAK